MNLLILLALFAGIAVRIMSPEERARYLGIAIAFLRDARGAATVPRPEYESFRDALRARTRHLVVVPTIVAVNVAVVVAMLVVASAIGDSATLVRWGANLGPRTTNGEWWRLVTSAFVHTGTLQLLVDAAVLIQLGAIVERLVGPLAIVAVYASAGALAGAVHLSSHPVGVGVETSAAIFGIYGLLLACLMWQMIWHRHAAADRHVTIPLIAVKRLGLVAVVFLVCSALDGLVSAGEFAGLLVGIGYGLVLGRRACDRAPSARSVAALAAATVAIAAAYAIPLRNIADVKPELVRVITTEERTATTYTVAFDGFRHGRLTAEALAQLAERIIVPELQAADARLQALEHVPPEHQPLVAEAREFLQLRCASWHARAEAIRRMNTAPRRQADITGDAPGRLQAEARFRSNMAAAGNAETAERVSLAAFERVRRAIPSQQD